MCEPLHEPVGDVGIYLRRTEESEFCLHTLNSIPAEEWAIHLKSGDRTGWLSLIAVTDLIDAFCEFEPSGKGMERFDGQSCVMHSPLMTADHCVVCAESATNSELGYTFFKPSVVGKTDDVWMHERCVEGFCEALDRMWDHTDTFGHDLLPKLI